MIEPWSLLPEWKELTDWDHEDYAPSVLASENFHTYLVQQISETEIHDLRKTNEESTDAYNLRITATGQYPDGQRSTSDRRRCHGGLARWMRRFWAIRLELAGVEKRSPQNAHYGLESVSIKLKRQDYPCAR